MNKSTKEESVSQIKELLENAGSVFLIDYEGVTVSEISQIRDEFRKENIKYKVFKNTLFKRALNETGQYQELNDLLVGMTGVAVSGENAAAVAKIIKKHSETGGKFKLKGCYVENSFFEGARLEEVASLPTKDEVIAGIIHAVNYPATGIVGAINALMRDITSIIGEIEKKKAA